MALTDVTPSATRSLPLVPTTPLPYRTRFKAARSFTDGQIAVHQAGGPVTRNVLGPKWLTPPLVFVASPQAVHDVLARTDTLVTIVRTAEITSVADDFPLAVPFTAVAAAPILATIRKRAIP